MRSSSSAPKTEPSSSGSRIRAGTGSPAASIERLHAARAEDDAQARARKRAPRVAEAAREDLEGVLLPAVMPGPLRRAVGLLVVEPPELGRDRRDRGGVAGAQRVEVRVDARGQVPPAAVEARHHARREIRRARSRRPAAGRRSRRGSERGADRPTSAARPAARAGIRRRPRRPPGREHNVITSPPLGQEEAQGTGAAPRARTSGRSSAAAALAAVLAGTALVVDTERGGRLRRAQAADRARRHGDRRGRRVRASSARAPSAARPWSEGPRSRRAALWLAAAALGIALVAALASPRRGPSLDAARSVAVFALLLPLGASRVVEKGRAWLAGAFLGATAINAVVSILQSRGRFQPFLLETVGDRQEHGRLRRQRRIPRHHAGARRRAGPRASARGAREHGARRLRAPCSSSLPPPSW